MQENINLFFAELTIFETKPRIWKNVFKEKVMSYYT